MLHPNSVSIHKIHKVYVKPIKVTAVFTTP